MFFSGKHLWLHSCIVSVDFHPKTSKSPPLCELKATASTDIVHGLILTDLPLSLRDKEKSPNLHVWMRWQGTGQGDTEYFSLVKGIYMLAHLFHRCTCAISLAAWLDITIHLRRYSYYYFKSVPISQLGDGSGKGCSEKLCSRRHKTTVNYKL